METTRKLSQALLWGTFILLLTSIPVSHVAAQTCVSAPSGMIHWYPGDVDGSDIVGADPGTLESGASAGNPGKVDGAFQFDGASGGVNLGNVADLDFDPSSSFTIEAWVNYVDFTPAPNDGEVIVALNYNCSPTAQILGLTTQGPDTGKLHFTVRDANGSAGVVVSPSTLSPNAFHHVAGVREVAGNTKTVRLYVDGELVATAVDPSTGALAIDTSDLIGRRNLCGTINTLKGLIDEVTIYNRALSAAEVQSIFLAGSAGKCLDATPPTFGACPAGGPFLLNSGSQPVGPIAAEDPESGIDTANSRLTGAVDTSAVGPQTVTFIAVNTEGSEATKDCDYDVHYHFSGFFQPIDDTLLNSAKAGQTIPVKWRLTDAHGAPVSDPQSFVNVSSSATPGACGGAADAIETYAGSSGLQYLGEGYWQFNWKTPKAYAGQCRTMRLNLQDGAPGRTAAFIFK